jgi:hypothetical protein
MVLIRPTTPPAPQPPAISPSTRRASQSPVLGVIFSVFPFVAGPVALVVQVFTDTTERPSLSCSGSRSLSDRQIAPLAQGIASPVNTTPRAGSEENISA